MTAVTRVRRDSRPGIAPPASDTPTPTMSYDPQPTHAGCAPTIPICRIEALRRALPYYCMTKTTLVTIQSRRRWRATTARFVCWYRPQHQRRLAAIAAIALGTVPTARETNVRDANWHLNTEARTFGSLTERRY